MKTRVFRIGYSSAGGQVKMDIYFGLNAVTWVDE